MLSRGGTRRPWGLEEGLLLLRRASRALEGGSSERQHLLGVGHEDFEWGRRTTKGAFSEDISAASVPVFAAPLTTVDT